MTLTGPTTASPTFTAPTGLTANKALEFSLKVNDGTNDSAADTVTVTVDAAPAANAGDDQTVAENASVTLDGSKSSDPGGGTVTWAWTAPSGVTLSSTTVAKPTFTAPTQLAANKELSFDLTVSDSRSQTATDTVTVTVTAGTNDAPTANAGPDQTVAEAASVTLDGSKSSDPEGETLTYAWTAPEGMTLTGDTTAAPTFTAPSQLAADEALVFSLVVTDARNAASAADTVTVTVTAGDNDAPTAEAGDAQTVDEGVPVTLSGSGTDPEGETLTYAWTAPSDVTLDDATAASPTFTAPTGLTANKDLEFSLKVKDARNSESAADTVTVTVDAVPTADAGDDQDTVAEGATVTLDGSESADPGGGTLKYAWTQTSGTTMTLSDAKVERPTFTAPSQLVTNAELEFSLTVTDTRDQASAADTVKITVVAGDNDKPTADAGDDQTVDEGGRGDARRDREFGPRRRGSDLAVDRARRGVARRRHRDAAEVHRADRARRGPVAGVQPGGDGRPQPGLGG